MAVSSYYGWIGIFFFVLFLISTWYLEPEIKKGKKRIKFKYYRELRGTLIFLAGLFISLKVIKYDPGGFKGPGEWGFLFIFWSVIVIAAIFPTVVQKKINKITGKKGEEFEKFYKWLYLVPGYFVLLAMALGSEYPFFNNVLDNLANLIGESWVIAIGMLVAIVAGFHFLKLIIEFFEKRSGNIWK